MFEEYLRDPHKDPPQRPPRLRKIVMLSDIHDQYHHLGEPEQGDILLLAGDLTNRGKESELIHCNNWLAKQDFTHKVVIPGNHDITFETKWPWAESKLFNADAILDQELYVADGIKIWGEPRQPFFYDWAFNVRRGDMKKQCWDKVPPDIDILLTHGPPWGVLDQNEQGVHCGDVAQREWILEYQPRMVVCGHIHPGRGIALLGKTMVVNAANCGGGLVRPPITTYMGIEV